MDPISNLNKIVESLRRRVGESPGKVGQKTGGAQPGAVTEPAGNHIYDLQRQVAERIRAVDADDPHRREKATRIFLESVLRREYGDGLLNDPRFLDMLEDIQASMEADPATR